MHHDNTPGQADLPAMGVPRKEKVDAPLRSPGMHLRRMREQDFTGIYRHTFQSTVKIVGLVEVGVVDTRKAQALPASLNQHTFVEQETHTRSLQRRQFVEEVMIAQDSVHRRLQSRENTAARRRRSRGIAKSGSAEIAGDYDEVILQSINCGQHGIRKAGMQIGMQIRQLQDAEAVKSSRQTVKQHLVVLHTDIEIVPHGALPEPATLEANTNESVEIKTGLQMKKAPVLATSAAMVQLLLPGNTAGAGLRPQTIR